MAVSEARMIFALVALTLLLGATGIFVTTLLPQIMRGDLYVSDYTATLYPNGTLTEEYTYTVTAAGEYRMLYRIWDATLSLQELNTPQLVLEGLEGPPGCIPYLKDYSGTVWIPPPYDSAPYRSTIASLAELNEVGIFNPSRFDAGSYTLRCEYRLRPLLEYDSKYCHLNLKLADAHVAYESVTVVIEGADLVAAVYPHPPSMEVTSDGQRITISGSSGQDQLLEVELLYRQEVLTLMDGFPTEYPDVAALTAQANDQYGAQYYSAVSLSSLADVLLLAAPFFFLLIWAYYGRERPFTVPSYLSTVPNSSRKPWLVNLAFKGDPTRIDSNAFYATLLDLKRRGNLEISQQDGGIRIRIISSEGVDPYERDCIDFLQNFSANGIVDSAMINSRVDGYMKAGRYTTVTSLQREWADLTRGDGPGGSSRFLTSGRFRLWPIAAAGILLLIASLALSVIFPIVSSISLAGTVASLFIVVQTVVAAIFPPDLFGKWKGDYYRERLQWDSFRKFLSDLAMIKKYAPQDISMWGEWLVFGTALGVGDEVVRAMRDLNVRIPEMDIAPFMFLMFRPVYVARVPSSAAGTSGT